MTTNLQVQWNHKWFGFWKNTKPYTEIGPDVSHFIDVGWGCYDVERVASYLLKSPSIITFASLQCPICDFCGGGSIRTDGHLMWRDDIAHHMMSHQVAIPDLFLNHIRSKVYSPCLSVEIPLSELKTKLEWPEKLHNLVSAIKSDSSGLCRFKAPDGQKYLEWVETVVQSDYVQQIKRRA